MVAMLRAQGTPARARCGFGGYFNDGLFEDHWVCEYWHAGQQRWLLVDAQIDGKQRGWFPIDFDVTDVPRDRFLVAGEAWTSYRSGQADPGKFGLSVMNESGDWWIAANLMRDAAALAQHRAAALGLLGRDAAGRASRSTRTCAAPCSTGWPS